MNSLINIFNRSDTSYLILFTLSLIPFALIWFFTFRFIKEYIKTLLNYSALLLFTLVGLIAYFLLITFIARNHEPFNNIITGIIYPVVLICEILFVPVLLLTLILTIIHFIKRKRSKTV